jgi:Ca2+-binding RTX toxin-like protein
MEREPLEGMNIIGDVFNGSDDSTSLVLTDDDNGDALFLDDIYSASPDISTKARISHVNMIIAGAGDDIIDLTSVRFQCADKGIAVQGGDGNDVIWANNNGTFLLGDAGDDRIVGGNGYDVIAGGAGDDTLHGGGGVDYFCFGGAWGDDTVAQLDGGKAWLWFDGVKREDLSLSADAEGNAVLSCDSGSVTLSGVKHDDVSAAFDAGGNKLSDNILLQFGDSGLDEEAQSFADTLRNAGVFKEFVSDRIFDDMDKGMLA